MIEFTLNGWRYRTNSDASTVEAYSINSNCWVRTYSLQVIAKAHSILGI